MGIPALGQGMVRWETRSWRVLMDLGHIIMLGKHWFHWLGSPMPKGQLAEVPNHFWSWGFHSSISWAGTGKVYP